jgi:hypothetical protein
MADMFDACLAFTLREEGGHVDDYRGRGKGRRSNLGGA